VSCRRLVTRHFDIPSMVGVNELVAAFPIGRLCVDEEMRAQIVSAPQGLGKPHAKILRYTLSGDGTDVQTPCSPPLLSR
jgi:hypothetical protein